MDPVGYGGAIARWVRSALPRWSRCINKLVCRRARGKLPTLCRERRMRKRRMHFGGKAENLL